MRDVAYLGWAFQSAPSAVEAALCSGAVLKPPARAAGLEPLLINQPNSQTTRRYDPTSGGEFASTDSPTRIQDAGLQERWIGPTISLNSRRSLQHLQCSTPSDEHAAEGHIRCVKKSEIEARCVTASTT
jgi:hypothetical protein